MMPIMPRLDFSLSPGIYAPQSVLRYVRLEDGTGEILASSENLYLTYALQTPSGWTEANLFRDIYGSHKWVLTHFGGPEAVTGTTYYFGPALGAAEAKKLAIDLLYRLCQRPEGVRPQVVIATCNACGAPHVWPRLDGHGQDRTSDRPSWCWVCHNASRNFTVVA